jgi:AcrR family transcriptional regulator
MTKTATAARPTLREQQLKLREDVILREVNALLAEKGYDLMTVDEVAARVGLAKPSLYRHFASKEALAAAAMTRLLERARRAIDAQSPDAPAIDRLQGVVRWAVREHLDGQMPSLPSTRSALRESLLRHAAYVDRLIDVSDRLGAWITEAQRKKAIAPRLPPEVVLYTLFARACDPVSDYLKLSGNYTDDEIVDLITTICFDGLAARR